VTDLVGVSLDTRASGLACVHACDICTDCNVEHAGLSDYPMLVCGALKCSGVILLESDT
jgi:hypothetical protein